MARRLRFKPPDAVINDIKNILYNNLWENKTVWEEFYSTHGWKLQRIVRYNFPCDYTTTDIGSLYSLKGFHFIPPQTSEFQNISKIVVKINYDETIGYWYISFSVRTKHVKKVTERKEKKEKRKSELGPTVHRLSWYYRAYIRGKSPSEIWYRHLMRYKNEYYRRTGTWSSLNIWQWIIKMRYNLALTSSYTPAVIPEENFRKPLYPVISYELDYDTPEIYLVIQHDTTAIDSVYKVRTVRCRCPIYQKDPKRAKVLTSHDGRNGLKIPVLQNLLARYKEVKSGGILFIVERIWRRSGAGAISYFWMAEGIVERMGKIIREGGKKET